MDKPENQSAKKYVFDYISKIPTAEMIDTTEEVFDLKMKISDLEKEIKYLNDKLNESIEFVRNNSPKNFYDDFIMAVSSIVDDRALSDKTIG